MTFTRKQLDSDDGKTIAIKDLSTISPFLPQSSDQKLLEVSNIKEKITNQITMIIKQTSIDCNIHTKSNNKEGIKCISTSMAVNPSTRDFIYNPDYIKDSSNPITQSNNTRKVNWIPMMNNGAPIAFKHPNNNEVYDYNSVINGEPRLIGHIVLVDGKERIQKLHK